MKENLKTWPVTVYLQNGECDAIPTYEQAKEWADSSDGITWSYDQIDENDIEYIRADLVKIKTEEEIKEIIGVTLDDRLEAFDVVDSALVNAIFDALKNAGLHCK